MREIKFRAWRDGEMLYQQQEGNAYVAALFNRIYGQHSVMQYTGLKDKNGKEIHEGDILFNCDNFSCITGWGGGEYDDHPSKKLVAWDDTDAKFKLEFINEKYRGRGVSGFTLCKSNCENRFEVIGNIYQNPELL